MQNDSSTELAGRHSTHESVSKEVFLEIFASLSRCSSAILVVFLASAVAFGLIHVFASATKSDYISSPSTQLFLSKHTQHSYSQHTTSRSHKRRQMDVYTTCVSSTGTFIASVSSARTEDAIVGPVDTSSKGPQCAECGVRGGTHAVHCPFGPNAAV